MAGRFDVTVLPIRFETPTRQIAIATNKEDIRSNTLNHIIEHLDENLKRIGNQ